MVGIRKINYVRLSDLSLDAAYERGKIMRDRRIKRTVCPLILACVLLLPLVGVQPLTGRNFSAREQELIKDHVYGGLPGTKNIYVRNGYVLCYNPQTRTPNWVAYHIVPDYRKTPERKGTFKKFRGDPNITNEAKDSEYNGMFTQHGYARGHLAPYGIMGGDRDNDGKYAEYNAEDSLNIGDEDDAETVYQGNYMSNIAPQHHYGFNGSPGLWWKLERWIQDDLVVKEQTEVWVFAGCVFGTGEHEKVGPNKNIWVPPMFYKIVIWEDPDTEVPVVLAYLFPHQRIKHGVPDDFLVSIDIIEALAGVDFFQDLDDDKEKWLETQDTWKFALQYFKYEDEN